MSKDYDQLSVRDAVHTMRNQLAAVRGNAHLLAGRLEREAGSGERRTDACQTIIKQTQLIETALARLVATSPQLLSGTMPPNADRTSCLPDPPPPQGTPLDASRFG